jgi:hypothetical protein
VPVLIDEDDAGRLEGGPHGIDALLGHDAAAAFIVHDR